MPMKPKPKIKPIEDHHKKTNVTIQQVQQPVKV